MQRLVCFSWCTLDAFLTKCWLERIKGSLWLPASDLWDFCRRWGWSQRTFGEAAILGLRAGLAHGCTIPLSAISGHLFGDAVPVYGGGSSFIYTTEIYTEQPVSVESCKRTDWCSWWTPSQLVDPFLTLLTVCHSKWRAPKASTSG